MSTLEKNDTELLEEKKKKIQPQNQKRLVLLLEGDPAAGKSDITNKLEGDGFVVIHEEFGEKTNQYEVQGSINEMGWQSKWYPRFDKTLQTHPNTDIFISDRSPRTPCFYVRSIRRANDGSGKVIGESGSPKIKKLFRELREVCDDELLATHNVVMVYIYILVDKTTLNKRRLKRLKEKGQKWRLACGEDDQDYIDKVRKAYQKEDWDITITNNSPNEGYNLICHIIDNIRNGDPVDMPPLEDLDSLGFTISRKGTIKLGKQLEKKNGLVFGPLVKKEKKK